MALGNHRKFGIVSGIVTFCFLFYGFESRACKRTPEAAEIAFRSAVLQEIKNQKDLDGFQVTGNIHHKLNIYTVYFKNGSSKRTATFEVIGKANCKVTAKRLPEQ